ncbi:MAG: FHA domain-containing protein [Salaquimonas sp.]
MSNENPTRIIRPNQEQKTPEVSDSTRVIGGETSSGGNHVSNNDPSTRIISSNPQAQGETGNHAQDMSFELAAGWLVITEGPGRGCTREIYYGMNSIGRGQNERISLDFGDTAISREAHAYIVFDEKQLDFYIQHGGKSNLVRLNGAPVLAPQELKRGDEIEIGSSKLLFVPLCGEDFKWEKSET